MRILVLGGTSFLGRHTVAAALERGHEVTLFHRGETNPGLFPDAEEVLGDREHDLDRLGGRKWDAVIDVPGYVPRIVRLSAQLLAKATPHYTFVSSISAYAAMPTSGLDEDNPLAELSEPGSEDVAKHYGALKVLCEREVQAAFPAGALIIRPGMIVGPNDPTDRFTHWPVRIAEGGEVLAPGNPERQIQLIDARDLASWNIELVEQGVTGVFSATGPGGRMSMRDMLEACRRASSSDARFTWVSEEFLAEQEVGAWMEMPFWMPHSNEALRGLLSTNIGRALAAGLTFRPIEETVRDTLAWQATRGAEHEWKAGMARPRERDLLAAWRNSVTVV